MSDVGGDNAVAIAACRYRAMAACRDCFDARTRDSASYLEAAVKAKQNALEELTILKEIRLMEACVDCKYKSPLIYDFFKR